MKTVAEWNQEIINMTMKIHQEFPELSKYIEEMPVKVSEKNKVEIDIRNLDNNKI